jgi:hypothetical protein
MATKESNMQVSDIDEDLVEIIEYLNENGLRPFASCDGVHIHHSIDNRPNNAYIAMLKSEKIIDLMVAFLRDRDSFTVGLSNNPYFEKYELYGNEISGNTYGVYFQNSIGERTGYVEKIIRGIVSRRNNYSSIREGSFISIR